MTTEAPQTNPIVSRNALPELPVPARHLEQTGPATLGPQPLAVLATLWSCDTPLTVGRLAGITGMPRAEVEDALGELRARKLLQTLNTVIESYQPCGAPGGKAVTGDSSAVDHR
jgi:hypothetical protein